MREIDKIAEGLFEKIRDRFEDVSLGDEKAKAIQDPEKARFFNFDYVVDGENHGNITMSIIDETSLKVYFSKNITDELDDHEKKHWYSFLRELREFARRNLLSFEPRDITRSTLKHRDIQQQSKADSTYAKDEVVAESKLYGTSKSSYQKFGPARIIVRHSKHVTDESRGERSRHINSIYVENHEGERFKMPFKSLTASRAMARHISAGGTPHDDLGQHISEMAEECGKLKPFLNNVRHRMFEDEETNTMVEAAFDYHKLLKNTLQRMSGKKGYTTCKEQFVHTSTSYVPEEDVDLNEIKERFVKRVFNDKMEDALPLVHKAYTMKKENKFTEQFENWATAISEGTWALPQTEEDKQKLIDLLSQELPVGVDAMNATDALYNIFGDDILFDRLGELAEVDPQADARDAVMERLSEVNPQMYQAVLDAIGDEDTPEPEGEVEEGNTYGSGDGGMDGVVYEETDQDDQLANIESIQSAIIRRILHNIEQHGELLKKAGPEGVMNASLDVASFHAPMEEIGSSDVSIMVREVYREVGVEYPETNEAKDTVEKDPKTGKIKSWSHEGDWKKQTKKDPVGKIHHMSDVARRRTEKMAKDETLEEAFNRALGEEYDTRDAYELDDPKHPDFVKNYEEFKAKNPNAKLADFIAHLRSRKNESVAGDDHVNKDVKMKRMGAKELSITDKFKIMPSQIQAMKKGDSEDDLLHYNKLQSKNPMAESVDSPTPARFEALRAVEKQGEEGIVLLGAGGKLSDWINGVFAMWQKEGITKANTPADVFADALVLKTTGGRTDLALVFKPGADLEIGKMAMWRLKFGDCSWISDYVVNYAEQHGFTRSEEDLSEMKRLAGLK